MSMRQMWNESWNVNTTGTQIITSTFAPLLIQSSNPRLLFITSGTSTLAGTDNLALAVNKPPAKGWPKSGSFNVTAYRSSKAGMNMMMLEWHRILKEDGVKVWCISPGLLATGLGGNPEMMKKMGGLDPAVGGNLVVTVLEGQRDKDVGRVVMTDGVQAW
jgi:NAD(P)-dependent dehydrogenase (short-subunit alcohol dehydrogenase family)